MENEENVVTNGDQLMDEETALGKPARPLPFIAQFKNGVKTFLVGSGAKTKDFLIQEEAEAILQTRKMAAKKAYLALLAAQKELDKLLIPDNERYDVNGKLVSADYTKGQAKKIGELRKEISDLETMLKNALEKDDFNKLVEKYGKA